MNTLSPNSRQSVQSDPLTGVRIIYGPGLQYRWILEQSTSDPNGVPLKPVKARIEVTTSLTPVDDENKRFMTHEDRVHNTFLSGAHSKCPLSLAHGAPHGPTPADKGFLTQDVKGTNIYKGLKTVEGPGNIPKANEFKEQ